MGDLSVVLEALIATVEIAFLALPVKIPEEYMPTFLQTEATLRTKNIATGHRHFQ